MKATLLKTNAGKGYKIVINDIWLYISLAELEAVVSGTAKACQFRSSDEFQQTSEEEEVVPIMEQEIEA